MSSSSPNDSPAIVSDSLGNNSVGTKSDWRTRPIYLMALERFLEIRPAIGGIPDFWEKSLKESPTALTKRLIEEGLLIPVELVRAVEFGSSSAELKAMAKERGLKLSGRKEELAKRLVEADPEGMATLFKNKEFLTCSTDARYEVELFVSRRLAKADQAAENVRAALEEQDFLKAIEIAQRHKASEITIDLPNTLAIHDSVNSVTMRAAELQRIYTVRPRILKDLVPEDWRHLATVVAMGSLLGRMPVTWLPATFKGIEKFEHAVSLRMFQFHLKYLDNIDRMRSSGVTKVTVSDCGAEGGSCPVCVKMAAKGKVRKLEEIPELPYEHCTCHLGCRCIVTAEVDMN